jgi:hypothetical protein
VAGFSSRHGRTAAEPTRRGLQLTAEDGEYAAVELPFPPWSFPPWSGAGAVDGEPAAVAEAPLDRLVEAATAHVLAGRRVGALLVRRGGYACAVLDGGAVVASKVGSRYVQGRTAAGGWSQQRFARRRANQADGLVDAAVGSAVRILLDGVPGPSGGLDWLVTGGDRPLVEQALADPRLRAAAALRRGAHLTIGDPKRDLVQTLPALLRQVAITLSDTGTAGRPPGPALPG